MNVTRHAVEVDADAGLVLVLAAVEEVGDGAAVASAEVDAVLAERRGEARLAEELLEPVLNEGLPLSGCRLRLGQVLRDGMHLDERSLCGLEQLDRNVPVQVLVVETVPVSLQAVDAG